MSKKANYDNWSKEELIKELKRIKETKYGLVWHRDKETEEKLDILINLDAKTPSETFSNEVSGKPFPVLKEVKGKQILTNKNKLFNLLIEGDNYHALAVLNFTHQEAVDLIYIDPPYNTGSSDFIYNDKIVDLEDPFRHSKWLSFMEKRLKLAKNLLRKNGVIFISIDDNEQAQLKLLCDEIFGPNNFIANLVWRKKRGYGRGNSLFILQTEYILCYAKDISEVQEFKQSISEHKLEAYKYKDNFGFYKREGLDHHSPRGAYERKTLQYDLVIDGKKIYCPTGQWLWSKDRVGEELKNFSNNGKLKEYKYLEIVKDTQGRWRAYKKIRLDDESGEVRGEKPLSLIDDSRFTTNYSASEINDIFGEPIFNYSKPTNLIKYLINFSSDKNAVILDFFAGSGTTGQAVLSLNDEDRGNRKFILCTNDENKICNNVCYPRIEKIINGYKNPKNKEVKGLGGNLKYFTAYDFVEAKETDQNKRKLVNKSTEMLCIKENAFELIQDEDDFKIFKNSDHYLGVIFYEEAIDDYKKAIKKINGHFNTYVFSLGDDPHERQFSDVKNKVSLCAIPEVILKVYREIFK